jgi:hypothetical protein
LVLIYLYEILFHYAMHYSDSLMTTAIFNRVITVCNVFFHFFFLAEDLEPSKIPVVKPALGEWSLHQLFLQMITCRFLDI